MFSNVYTKYVKIIYTKKQLDFYCNNYIVDIFLSVILYVFHTCSEDFHDSVETTSFANIDGRNITMILM